MNSIVFILLLTALGWNIYGILQVGLERASGAHWVGVIVTGLFVLHHIVNWIRRN